ncbi:MAG TPA: hypothetical protein VKT19_00240, partial [Steroidobacteraceae bacterium]|nr:hypothetical protein [Steroidobacteraceae bacterium]
MGNDNPNRSGPVRAADAAPVAEDLTSAWWIRLLSHLPWAVIYGLSALIIGCARRVFRYRVRVARENLRRCFPECSDAQIDRLLSRNYRHLAQVMAEFFKTA